MVVSIFYKTYWGVCVHMWSSRKQNLVGYMCLSVYLCVLYSVQRPDTAPTQMTAQPTETGQEPPQGQGAGRLPQARVLGAWFPPHR